MNYEQRKVYFEHLKTLVKSEYDHVFRILKRNKENWTENSNGIFFDVAAIKEDTFEQLREYMNFCIANRKTDETRSKELASLSAETSRFLVDGYMST